ncbi:MAG: trp operon repressor [Treponema sp.]|jgi:TrpR family trp operon transcriptional repressor|nr:trp operon repressor [Treponema sp.]
MNSIGAALSPDVERALREICQVTAMTTDENLIADFFDCLFTPSERQDMAKRWLLVREIISGTTQREISRKLGLSLCKITRGSREVKKPDSAFKKMLALLS